MRVRWGSRSFFMVVLLLGASVAYSRQSPGSLVGHWPMDEGTGSTTEDVSGQSVDGIISGATWVNDVTRGNVLSFDGDGDLVTINDFVTEFGPADFTLAAWVKIPSGSAGALIAKADADESWESGEKQLWFGDGNICCNNDGAFTSFVGYGNSYLISGTELLTDWHHIAVVWDYSGSEAKGSGTIYVDAIESSLTTANYAAYVADNVTDIFIIGHDESEEAVHDFFGLVDDVAVFDAALSQPEILAVYNGDYSAFVTEIFIDGFETGDTGAWSSSTR